jgi:hypothetical protein
VSTGAIAGIWSSGTEGSAGASSRLGDGIFAMVPLIVAGIEFDDHFTSWASRGAVAVADGV